jgi:hypothetical protein
MKYARRSVSDQDIRRYEMFAQVWAKRYCLHDIVDSYPTHRTCSSLVDSGATSGSLRAWEPVEHLAEQVMGMLGSPMTHRMTICMLEEGGSSLKWGYTVCKKLLDSVEIHFSPVTRDRYTCMRSTLVVSFVLWTTSIVHPTCNLTVNCRQRQETSRLLRSRTGYLS